MQQLTIRLEHFRIQVDVGGDQVGRHQVGEKAEPEQGNLCENFSLVGNAGCQNVVECGDPVGGDQ